jgi:DNA processing protein
MVLGNKRLHPDELVEQTQIPMRRVLSALTLLQVRGYIKEENGKRFCALVRLK